MVSDHLVYLCSFLTCSAYKGLERKEGSHFIRHWIYCRFIHLFRGQLSHLWTAQLSLIFTPLEIIPCCSLRARGPLGRRLQRSYLLESFRWGLMPRQRVSNGVY